MALLLLDPPRQLLHLDLVRVVLYHLVLEYGVVLLVNFAPIVFLDDLLLLLPLRHIQIVLALPLGILSQLVSVSLGVGGSLRGGLALTDGAVLALAEDGEVSLLGRNGRGKRSHGNRGTYLELGKEEEGVSIARRWMITCLITKQVVLRVRMQILLLVILIHHSIALHQIIFHGVRIQRRKVRRSVHSLELLLRLPRSIGLIEGHVRGYQERLAARSPLRTINPAPCLLLTILLVNLL